MDNHKDAAEKVRPILRAMERSIDAARRRRTQRDDAPATEVRSEIHTPEPSDRPGTLTPVNAPNRPQDPAPSQDPPRLKARPKRTLLTDFDQNDVRSRAS